jgi:colicin import membrane protein
MPSATDRLDFGPPRDAGSLRAFGLALLVHVLLIAALTWGVNWKRSDQTVSFEAELWSSVPQEAAPKLVETAPTPPPPAPLPPTPLPPPRPAPAPPEVKVAPPLPDVDIALEQEKKRKLLQQQKEAEAQKVLKAEKAAEKLKAELQAKKEKEKEKAQQAKEELAKRKVAEEAKKEAAIEAKKQEAKDQEKQKLAAAAAERLRQDALKRMMGLAGATGSADAKGSAQKSSGPSASYDGKVRAAVKPNVVFTDDIAGNPKAEIEVRTTLDGTIISQRLVKSSGNKAWDDAAIKGVIRTGTLPRDVDGRVPTPMTLIMSPKD